MEDELLQLGDAAALREKEGQSLQVQTSPEGQTCLLTYLHPVDVGRMVPAATKHHGSFTAAVGNQTLIGLDPDVLSPVRGVEAPAALELRGTDTSQLQS